MPRCGVSMTPTGCWTGWRCRGGTGSSPPIPSSTAWCCWTSPTMTASGSSTGWGADRLGNALPDHDSVRLEHRLEVDRLVQLVDVLVWVLDPQKYADAAVHERYLVPLAGHAGGLVVVLNQVDRLDEVAAHDCVTDLRALLDREGLAATPVIVTSARTGVGLPELRAELGRRASARRAATDRLTADARGAAQALAVHCPPDDDHPVDLPEEGLTRALADAAGVPVVVAAVERSARREGTARTGWPLLRWTRRLRPDPLRRLHLGDERARTSLPEPGALHQAALGDALRRVRTAAGEGLPQAWRDELQRIAERTEDGLAGRLDRAVAGADLGPDRVPLWQRAVGGLQWLLALVALVGVGWLVLLAVLGWLQLDGVVPVPRVQGFPLPTLLLAGGLLAGALLALLVRPFVLAGARRRGGRTRARLSARGADVARDSVLDPLQQTVADSRRFCAAVHRAAS